MKNLNKLTKKANDLGYDVYAELFIYYLDENKNIIKKYENDAYVDYEVLNVNKDLFKQIEDFKNTHENYKEIEAKNNSSLSDVEYLQTEIRVSLYNNDEAIDDSDSELSKLINDMNVELFKFENTLKIDYNK